MFFSSKPKEQTLQDRIDDFFRAVDEAAKANDIYGANLSWALEKLQEKERMRSAYCDALPSANPHVYSGNMPEADGPVSALVNLIRGARYERTR